MRASPSRFESPPTIAFTHIASREQLDYLRRYRSLIHVVAPSEPRRPMTGNSDRETRWQTEAAFFDAQAKASVTAGITATDPAVINRYSRATLAGALYPREYAFALLGNPTGLSILEVGCGEGQNACLLALLGARVAGIDISPGAIEVARIRATVDRVSDRTEFRVGALEVAPPPEQQYDVVWCEAFLHHVLNDLDDTLNRLVAALKPGGRLIVIEPVSLSKQLRRLRQVVPVAANATPDERPLEPRELLLVQGRIPSSHTRYFRCFGRLQRFVLPGGSYEHAAAWQKGASNLMARADDALLSIPSLRRFASVVVVSGKKGSY